ncbi:restriction endonuclease subunit S [Brachyspira intermedia]|uniref:restriction endonuclease subunit S n=1 Tax=Brachyspira intermedia TaxID=84377 RepID=UPI00300663FA
MKNTHLPTGWQEFKLKDIGFFLRGSGISKKDLSDTGTPAIRYGDIYTKYNFVIKDISSYTNSKGTEIKKGDILFTGSGETAEEIGKSVAFIDDYKALAGGDIIIFRPNIDLNSIFLSYILNFGKCRKDISIMGQGHTVVHIYASSLEILKVILPPLDEQKRIAEVLSLCDDIIENLTELIEKKEQYKKGIMQRLLSGEVRFKGFTDEWKTVRLGDILSYEQPNNYIVKNDEYNNKYECPVLTAGKTFILGYTNEKFGIYDKIPVIIFDDFTTETKYVNFPFKVKSSAIKILSSNKCNLKLIYELIKMIKFNAESHKRYWISEYQYLEIKIPTSIEEQKKIAGLLSVIDEDIENLKKQLELRKQQKKGLMQRLLTGEVRI